MARFFLSHTQVEGDTVTVTGADAHHIAHVLRMRVGENLTVCDMQKNEYLCCIAEIRGNCVICVIQQKKKNDTELPCRVHIYQSLPKGDKMEFIVQKAVELGAFSVTPVSSARCVSRPDAEAAAHKCRRWQRIAEEAAKQCGRGMVPAVGKLTPLKQAMMHTAEEGSLSLFCYEGDGTVSLKKVLEGFGTEKSAEISVFIGPEGGYDIDEVSAARFLGFPVVGLGKRILRCETASGFVLSCIGYALEL